MSAPKTLQAKQDEKQRLAKAYRASQRAKWRDLCEAEPRLPAYRKALRRTQSPSAILAHLADSPLRRATPDVRYAVLRLIDRHCWRMLRRTGHLPLDDPMPPQTSVFFVAREMLAVR